MSKPSKRSLQVSKMIQRKIAVMLQQYKHDPRLNEIIITDVQLSADLKIAKIYFTVFNKTHANEVTKLLQQETKHIRHLLAHEMTLRYVPELHFIYDQMTEQAEHLHQLIDSL
ncbi:MAG: ribosome-binding factor A [Gammaproteobacteria bacterium RIFOXYB2_FULL_38_6]|nr:MAG: ribosome-binding factor A [Gammaproteobacteria bacterium RIFOXYB2_FULL_38_6]